MMQPHHKIYQEPLKNPWETFGHAFGYQLAMYTNSLRNQVPTLQKPMEMAPNSRLENTRRTIQRSLKKPFVSKRFKSKVQLWGFRGGDSCAQQVFHFHRQDSAFSLRRRLSKRKRKQEQFTIKQTSWAADYPPHVSHNHMQYSLFRIIIATPRFRQGTKHNLCIVTEQNETKVTCCYSAKLSHANRRSNT